MEGFWVRQLWPTQARGWIPALDRLGNLSHGLDLLLLVERAHVTVDASKSFSLRLVDPAAEAALAAEPDALLAAMCQAFEQATGWRIECRDDENDQNAYLTWSAPVEPGVGATLRLVRVASDQRAAGAARPIAAQKAAALADSIGRLWSEISLLRRGLIEREAELAADVPVVGRPAEPAVAAERMTAVLKAGAEAVGCQSAGLYLLDSATTSLKLRACWGLPERRLTAEPRPLRGALADLEALLGHAVVLSEPAMFEYWRAPEPCGAAVCVPVSTATTPLGTLWVYSHATRDFDDRQTNLLEVVAGRLAADLERDVLLADARASKQQQRQMTVAAGQTAAGRPRVAPLVDGWKIAGRMLAEREPSGAFFDWFALADRNLAVSLGAAVQADFAGALAAAQLRSALRAQAPQLARASQALHGAHEVLASLSAENFGAHAFCGLLDPKRDVLRYSAGGSVRVLIVEPGSLVVLNEPAPAIGTLELSSVVEISRRIRRGTTVLVYALGGAAPAIGAWTTIEAALAAALSEPTRRPAELAAELAIEAMRQNLPAELALRDGALLVLQRD